VTWRAVAIIIRVVLLSPYLCIRGVSVFHSLVNHAAFILTQDTNTVAQFEVKTWKHVGKGSVHPAFRSCSKIQHKITIISSSRPLILLLLNLHISVS
jgi:hypothetical protein